MIEPDSPDFEDLRTAVRLLEAPSLTVRIANLAGTPLDALMRRLPSGARERIDALVHAALHKAVDAALWSLAGRAATGAPSNRLHKALAATAGAVGGAFGLGALAVELPVTTTLMLRSIADIARSEGFDLNDPETRQACLEVLAFGGPSDRDDAAESGYYAARSFMAEATQALAKELTSLAARRAAHAAPGPAGSVLARVIEVVASRFGLVITEKFAAQAVPILGGLAGATLNTLFTDFYQDTARGHFIVKRLERQHGAQEVRAQYERLRGAS
ncbi:MAG: hypothetical protein RLZZ592_2289 [Pseudomonadota bacterium]|jgi:hypothetical protein